MSEKRTSSARETIIFRIATIVIVIVFVELIASYALLLRLRITNSQSFTETEPSYLSLINIPYKAGVRLFSGMGRVEDRIEIYPKPWNVPDSELGYRPKPGKFRVTYSRRARFSDEWEHFRVKRTRLADGTRWTGDSGADPRSTVYIFGDSFVAGSGVNDEQTFSYLLQQARKDLRVRLFAVEGYGMTQVFILFNRLRAQIKPNDIIILGYANFYDERNVVAPSWLREIETGSRWRQGRPPRRLMLPKATIDNKGAIQISHIQQRCSENREYCERDNPPRTEMARVTAALVNYIEENSEAKTFLLHFRGDKNNPVLELIDDSIIRVSALPGDFDYFIYDDIEGFDTHPGPYWHYAISRKLLEALDQHYAAN